MTFTHKMMSASAFTVFLIELFIFPLLLKFFAEGPVAQAVAVLIISNLCGSVVTGEVIRLALKPSVLMDGKRYWLFVLLFSVVLTLISSLGLFFLRGQ